MKYYNVELKPETAEAFKIFLKQSGIKYEASSCYNLVHFEVLLDEETRMICDNWIDINA